MKRYTFIIMMLVVLILTSCQVQTTAPPTIQMPGEAESSEKIESTHTEAQMLDENGSYTSAEDVATYIRTYRKLPSNYLRKNEARDQGWIAEEGNLRDLFPDAAIGGDRFGNREGLLPEEEGRTYYEADVNYEGGHRGAERLVYSNDGLVFYTDDHYDSFEDWTEANP